MNKKKRTIPAKDIFKKPGGNDGEEKGDGDDNNNNNNNNSNASSSSSPPSAKDFAEAHTPELSQNTFEIGGKTFQLRMSNIKTQKTMAMALDAITDLIKKIDLVPIFRGLQDRLNRDRNKMIVKIKKADATIDTDIGDSDDYLDMVELIRDIVSHGGLGNIVGTILDLYVGVIWSICKSQDETVSRDWIENNISFYNAQKIFFIQMQKDRIGGRIIDFLHMLTRQIIVRNEKTEETTATMTTII